MQAKLTRLLSLLLALALCLSFTLTGVPQVRAAGDYWWLPYVEQPEETFTAPGVQDGQVTSQGRYILLTSDVHRYAYLLKDLLAEANDVVHKDSGSDKNVGFLAMGGDYANEQSIYADNMTIMKHAVEDNSPGTVVAYSKGNHEGSVNDAQFLDYTGMARIGETAVNADGLYYYYNWGAETSKQTFLTKDIEDLDQWLSEHNDGKPVFMVSHFPIHYYNERRTTVNAGALMDVLNKYPQVVFCWGHNHTENDPAYGTIRTPGDVIQYGADPATETKELNFTYVNLGALRDGVNECNGLVAKVNDDHSVTYWYLGLGLQNEENGDTWTDAQGNENPIKLPTNPRVVSTTEVAPVTPDSLKTIELAQVQVERPLVDNTPAEAAVDYSGRFTAGKIAWTADGKPVEGSYDFDTAYTATFDLIAGEGYVFAENAKGLVNFSYVGPMGETYPANDTKVLAVNDSTMTLEVTFGNTVKQLEVPIEMSKTIEEGKTYVLVATDDKYAAYYRYNPDDHGEESRPEYTVAPADVVIREDKLASEVTPFVTFSAAQDGPGYLLFTDASIVDGKGAEALNYLSLTIRGGGEMQLEASETAGLSIYNNWNVDEDGNPYLDVDGAICYAAFDKGAFTCTTDKAACNVKLFQVGDAAEPVQYNVLAHVDAPKTGAAPATEAVAAGLTVKDVKWEPEAEVFAPATAYTVTLTVEAEKPFAEKALAARVNGNAATIAVEGNTATVTYTFGATDAEAAPAGAVKAVKADALEDGKTYVIVAEGQAATSAITEGLYLKGADVTVDGDAIAQGITKEMLFTAEAAADPGVFYLKGQDGYLMGKSVDNSPDCWGFTTSEKPALTVSYQDGQLIVEATGAAAPGGPGGPPPGASAANTVYWNDGHFNFSTLQADEITLYALETAYTDVDGHWAEPYILTATVDGLFGGNPDGTFDPAGTMTRGMVALVLYRMAGSPEAEGELPFTDVKEDAYYVDAVRWAADQKIANGNGDGTFSPDQPVSREAFTAFLCRFADAQGQTLSGDKTATFSDQDKIASYFVDNVAACVAAGIINGRDDGTFAPQADITRAEAAKMLVVFEGVAE